MTRDAGGSPTSRRPQRTQHDHVAHGLARVEYEIRGRAARDRRGGGAHGAGRRIHELFRRMAHGTAAAIGTPVAFMIALGAIMVWAVLGPVFGYSDTWQLVINTSTTIVTFLVVFMIQNTQNRDSQAIHLKLDELIRALDAARNSMVDVEDLPDEELARLQREMREACTRAQRRAGVDRRRSPKAKAETAGDAPDVADAPDPRDAPEPE